MWKGKKLSQVEEVERERDISGLRRPDLITEQIERRKRRKSIRNLLKNSLVSPRSCLFCRLNMQKTALRSRPLASRTTSLLGCPAIKFGFTSPYARRSSLDLGRQIVVSNVAKNKVFVDNAMSLINFSYKVMGQSFTNFCAESTGGAIWTAGPSIETLTKRLIQLNQDHLYGIVDYSAENHSEYVSEEHLDASCEQNVQSISAAAIHSLNSTALKFSVICSIGHLKSLNKRQVLIENLFWDADVEKKGVVTKEQMLAGIKNILPDCSDEEFTEVYNVIKEEDGTISEDNWFIHCHAVTFEKQFPLIERLCNFSEDEKKLTATMLKRFLRLIEHGRSKNSKMMIDAEQSYMQNIIDSLTEQYQYKVNQEEAILANTFQCYRKDTLKRLTGSIRRFKKMGVKTGVKLVRGAYMNEENHLAQKYGYDTPICDSIDETHQSYDQCLELLFSNWEKGGYLIIATHNENSSRLGRELMKKNDVKKDENIFFAQLLGFCDHLTNYLKEHDCKSCKYVPYGPTELLMPYLIRRAQESRHMMDSLKKSNGLIWNELFNRVPFKKSSTKQ